MPWHACMLVWHTYTSMRTYVTAYQHVMTHAYRHARGVWYAVACVHACTLAEVSGGVCWRLCRGQKQLLSFNITATLRRTEASEKGTRGQEPHAWRRRRRQHRLSRRTLPSTALSTQTPPAVQPAKRHSQRPPRIRLLCTSHTNPQCPRVTNPQH
jgi:hypothetical protein